MGSARDTSRRFSDSGSSSAWIMSGTVLRRSASPHHAYPSVLVAGTNGKGSVCAMLARVLSRHGFRVGLYTSPHLVRVEERIQDRGYSLSLPARFLPAARPPEDRDRRAHRLRKLDSPPTYFEILTILAFLYFRERECGYRRPRNGNGRAAGRHERRHARLFRSSRRFAGTIRNSSADPRPRSLLRRRGSSSRACPWSAV